MLICSVDSSATPASVCLLEDDRIIAEYYLNTGFTHSQTLMAMLESVLKISGKSADDLRNRIACKVFPAQFSTKRERQRNRRVHMSSRYCSNAGMSIRTCLAFVPFSSETTPASVS